MSSREADPRGRRSVAAELRLAHLLPLPAFANGALFALGTIALYALARWAWGPSVWIQNGEARWAPCARRARLRGLGPGHRLRDRRRPLHVRGQRSRPGRALEARHAEDGRAPDAAAAEGYPGARSLGRLRGSGRGPDSCGPPAALRHGSRRMARGMGVCPASLPDLVLSPGACDLVQRRDGTLLRADHARAVRHRPARPGAALPVRPHGAPALVHLGRRTDALLAPHCSSGRARRRPRPPRYCSPSPRPRAWHSSCPCAPSAAASGIRRQRSAPGWTERSDASATRRRAASTRRTDASPTCAPCGIGWRRCGTGPSGP